jgi:hypothetical protein
VTSSSTGFHLSRGVFSAAVRPTLPWLFSCGSEDRKRGLHRRYLVGVDSSHIDLRRFRNGILCRLSRALWLHGCPCGADEARRGQGGTWGGIVRISARATTAVPVVL